ncbi:MAG TPA: 3'-5' exonuclease [Deltaproteobacteria bacterium]|jgi:ribonuclease D|nr:3'-5' exonuclease [Deltaproteobacteria bacterium]HOI07951.1 3'-5' exonuclease [Deltaproteobacteria bacterium]
MSIIELKTDQEIYGYLNALERNGRRIIAVDVEAEFNLHCYGEHLCLIQVFDLENEIIIDPFKFRDGDGIKTFFESRGVLKIMYDSMSDAALLETYGIRLQSVLDLRPAVSLLEYPKQGLAHVLSEELGIAPVNKKKFQQYNWMRRPLDKAAIEYAMGDVRHLFRLKDALFDKLNSNGLMDAYNLQNLALQDGRKDKIKLEKYEKAKGYNRLNKHRQEMFKEIFTLRDAFAKKLNKPPDYVFSNARLLELCRDDIRDPAFVEQGINPRIDRSIQGEILVRFTEIVQSRLGTSGSR